MAELHPTSYNALRAAFLREDARAHSHLLARAVRAGADPVGAMRAHVLGDDWLDFALAGLRAHFEQAQGSVYLMNGPAHAGLVKLGKTQRDPFARLRSLNSAAVLLPLKLLAAWPVHDCHWVEAECHRDLGRQGVARAKEFFDALPEDLAAVVERVVSEDRARFEAVGLGSALPSAQRLPG